MYVKVTFLNMFSKVYFSCLLTVIYFRGCNLKKIDLFQLAVNSKYVECVHNRTLNLDISQVDIYFYDFSKNTSVTYSIHYAAQAILSEKTLDKNRKFIMFVGGYLSKITKRDEEQIRDAYKHYPNSYLIMVDHSVYTNSNAGLKTGFERAVKSVYYIGKALGKMLVELNAAGISKKNFHCVGHSLGAQMLAHTGEIFFNITGSKISRITALDPAGPCFSRTLINEQIRSGVADYVEVYHCNSGWFGTTTVLADVDFMVNKKGEIQPECGSPLIPNFLESPKLAACNHKTCISVWTASVKNPMLYKAYKCDSYKSFKKQKCSQNEMTIAGEGNPGTATGIFYMSTKNLDEVELVDSEALLTTHEQFQKQTKTNNANSLFSKHSTIYSIFYILKLRL